LSDSDHKLKSKSNETIEGTYNTDTLPKKEKGRKKDSKSSPKKAAPAKSLSGKMTKAKVLLLDGTEADIEIDVSECSFSSIDLKPEIGID
jgi:hypothetical protein